ncbi:uncharacterized protein LOC114523462 [Dendronephthya gigantea]|uniref:uncharacterized protein LOC114523462 n=1 Tax=Dendronephthya gigantea TaxID=151771 RepID=UPI00106972AE|nr:uncharacterized protein LOC114523462 [Dendronephthya gigantea]
MSAIIAMPQYASESEDQSDEIDIPCWMYDEFNVDGNSTERAISNELSFTTETVVRRLYYLARMMHNSLTSAGVLYWTSGGTLLGCVRHQGLIPWDDDLDLCIYQKDEGKITCLKRFLNDNGCELIEVPIFGYRVFHKFDSESLPGEYHNHRYPFCDIFVMKRQRQLISVIANGCGRSLWPEEYYYNKDIDNIQPKLFGDIFLNCPANADEYLERTYGESWYTEGSTHSYDHASKQSVKPVKFKMQPEHYEPARPYK